MIHNTLFADLAKVVAHVKKTCDEGDEHLPFAGMHVILMGDFHQFPRGENQFVIIFITSNEES